MSARPVAVTLVGWLFIAAGTIGLVYHAMATDLRDLVAPDALWVLALRMVAIVAGAFLLRGANWARRLLLAWLGYHVGLSALHSVSEAAVHALLLGLIAYALFRPLASAYFRSTR